LRWSAGMGSVGYRRRKLGEKKVEGKEAGVDSPYLLLESRDVAVRDEPTMRRAPVRGDRGLTHPHHGPVGEDESIDSGGIKRNSGYKRREPRSDEIRIVRCRGSVGRARSKWRMVRRKTIKLHHDQKKFVENPKENTAVRCSARRNHRNRAMPSSQGLSSNLLRGREGRDENIHKKAVLACSFAPRKEGISSPAGTIERKRLFRRRENSKHKRSFTKM